MELIKYIINGKVFNEHNIWVKSSKGIIGATNLKKVNTYDWQEQNGIFADVSNRKHEPRKIILECFVIGKNWSKMIYNQMEIVKEFQKNGLQELILDVPFGTNYDGKDNRKPIPYYVYLNEISPLEKRFKDEDIYGGFTIELIEPNPIKRVFITSEKEINYRNNQQKKAVETYVRGGQISLLPNETYQLEVIGKSGYNILVFTGDKEDLETINLNKATELWREF